MENTMRHIGFNESEVMGEYARIANEEGIVKAAETKTATPIGPLKTAVSRSSITDKILKKMVGLQQKLEQSVKNPKMQRDMMSPFMQASMSMMKYKSDLEPISAPLGRGIPGSAALPIGTGVDKNAEFVKYVADMSKRLKGQLQSILSADRILYSMLASELNVLDSLAHGAQMEITMATKFKSPMMPAPEAKADDGLPSATAANDGGKHYDVTGETGEQLIDSAHPGGGTKTELSSKTDENLVETIVEQQKRDIEVTKSVPKGTYATLVRLHDRLSKMGHGDRLSTLRDAILRVSTTNDIIGSVLVGLSDRLDVRGYEKSANRVDKILKKALLPALLAPVAPAAAWGLSELGGLIYRNWWGPVAGSLTNIIDRLGDLDVREGSAIDITDWTSKLNLYAEYFNRREQTGDPEANKQAAKAKLDQLTKLLPLLQQYQGEIKRGKDAGEFADLWDDVSEAYNAFDAAIKDITARKTKIEQEFPSFVKKVDEVTEAKEQGTEAKTDLKKEEEKGKGPAKRTILNDYKKAMIWAKKFNAVLIKVDKDSLVTDMHKNLTVATGDKAARDAKAVKGPFKKTLLRAIRYARAAGGGWAGLEKKLREDYKDELAKAYPGEAGAAPELPADKEAAVEKQRQKLFNEGLKMVAESFGGTVEDIGGDPKIMNIINTTVKSGIKYFNITNESGYNKIKQALIKRLREAGFLKAK